MSSPVEPTSAARISRDELLDLVPILLITGIIAFLSIQGIVQKLGHPGALLDDSYIHFQYARAIAEGHPFRYQAGEPISTGATSILWPAVLAPFYLLGFRGELLMWPAWILSYAAFAGLAMETMTILRPLVGRAAAAGGALMVLTFGGLIWCAASGMEVLPFAWCITTTLRRVVEWSERPKERTRSKLIAITLLATASVLFRPEGWVFAGAAAAMLVVFPSQSSWRSRVAGSAPIVAPVAVRTLLQMAIGGAPSNTALVKLLPGNPYYQGSALREKIFEHVEIFFTKILHGRDWSAEFLPPGAMGIFITGLFATVVLGVREKKLVRAGGILFLSAAMLIPCVYYTFLWNRLRYLWPFMAGWIMALACFTRLLGMALSTFRLRWTMVTSVLCGLFAGAFLMKLPGVLEDIVDSANGIDHQQVHLGHWIKEHLPADARVGVNDTGAIAYFGDRKTFDVVGLTTSTEPRYWVAGVGSRIEHYERAMREHSMPLPTHFTVYPDWMGTDALFGDALHSAVVKSSILGGEVMSVYEADYTHLGSGEEPWSIPKGTPALDALDVADLESEAEHGYDLYNAREGYNLVMDAAAETSGETMVLDGARSNRTSERFQIHKLRGNTKMVLRVVATNGAHVIARVNSKEIASFDLPAAATWTERALTFNAPSSDVTVELASDNPLTLFHYWFYDGGTP